MTDWPPAPKPVKLVKARVWPAYGQWRWTCPACHDGGHALDGNQCHDAARRHVDTWHRSPGMPATDTRLPADGLTGAGAQNDTPGTRETGREAHSGEYGPAHSMAHNQPTPTAWHQEA